MKIIKITKYEANQSVLKYVKKYLNNATLNFIEKLFRKKNIKINNHWVDKKYFLKENDILKIFISDEQINKFNVKRNIVPINFSSKIIFEDENILILNKKKGILVHEDKNEKKITLSNEVLNYFNHKKLLMGENFKPAPCHRLDRNTSGLVIFAKNIETLQIMEKIFKSRNINKYYLALVCGEITKDGEINKPLRKDENSGNVFIDQKNGKTAITKYRILKKFHNYSLLEVKLVTGRTHHIRVHMASINHPVVGDRKYGNFKINQIFKKKFKYHSQFLHAYKIKFNKIDDEKLKYLSNKTFVSQLNEQEDQILKLLT